MAEVIRRAFNALGDTGHAASDSASFGTASETAVWSAIEAVELGLRDLVRKGFVAKWGAQAEEHVVDAFSEKEQAGLTDRRSRHLRAFPLAGGPVEQDSLGYLYLGDLVRLIHGPAWDQFKPVFGEKAVLDGLLRNISPVRNDRAHFRPVPEKELQRCAIACDDILEHLKKAGAGAG